MARRRRWAGSPSGSSTPTRAPRRQRAPRATSRSPRAGPGPRSRAPRPRRPRARPGRHSRTSPGTVASWHRLPPATDNAANGRARCSGPARALGGGASDPRVRRRRTAGRNRSVSALVCYRSTLASDSNRRLNHSCPLISRSCSSPISSSCPAWSCRSSSTMPPAPRSTLRARQQRRRAAAAPRLDDRYASYGVVATIEQLGRLPGGKPAAVLRAEGRARIGSGVTGPGAALWVEAEELDDPEVDNEKVAQARGRVQVAGDRDPATPRRLADHRHRQQGHRSVDAGGSRRATRRSSPMPRSASCWKPPTSTNG